MWHRVWAGHRALQLESQDSYPVLLQFRPVSVSPTSASKSLISVDHKAVWRPRFRFLSPLSHSHVQILFIGICPMLCILLQAGKTYLQAHGNNPLDHFRCCPDGLLWDQVWLLGNDRGPVSLLYGWFEVVPHPDATWQEIHGYEQPHCHDLLACSDHGSHFSHLLYGLRRLVDHHGSRRLFWWFGSEPFNNGLYPLCWCVGVLDDCQWVFVSSFFYRDGEVKILLFFISPALQRLEPLLDYRSTWRSSSSPPDSPTPYKSWPCSIE